MSIARIALASLIILVAIIACGSPAPTQDVSAIYTSAAATVIAQMPTTTAIPNDAQAPASTSNSMSKLIVPAGELAQYSDTYANYKEVFVTKIDGSLDERPNDLEELCLDWLYYREKILEYTQAGETDKAAEARTSWNETNDWLDAYNENDVGAMFSIIDKRGK
jgi:hypothetical protein